MKRVYLVSVSGGKDSSVTWSYMEKNYAHKGLIVPYFSDTGWEHEDTYLYLDYLEKYFGKKIHRIKSDKYDGFEDMCIKKKMIPSRVRRFCTQELKIRPSEKFIQGWIDKGFRVVNVTGVRKEESRARSGEGVWKFNFFSGGAAITKRSIKNRTGCVVFQPIVDWTIHEVYGYAKQHGIDLNPLYYKGFQRVGCYPCIMTNKTEMGFIDQERISRISDLEKSVSEVSGCKRVWFCADGNKPPISYADMAKKQKYNTLGLDLGCINHLGKCE